MGYTPPHLEVRKIAGGYNVYPPSNTAGDDMILFCNGTDTICSLIMYGGSYMISKGTSFRYADATAERIKISYTDPDAILEASTADKNLYLKTNGTGVLKFGTYTAGAATDSTGYITILDAAGNTRKLMVQA